ncbi:MAG: hypothetical protein JWO31_1685 [Phycisphaerales bacterium]|nr:hypothetical protein [Phycisphaerales bacterium]
MKKIVTVLVLTLAANFVAVVGAVGWMFASGKLDRAKAAAVRELVFAPATQPADPAATQPAATQPTSRPAGERLDDLLTKYAGRRAGEQAELIQQAIDAQAAALDRRARDLDSLNGQVLREKEELARKSSQLDADRARLVDEQKQQAAQDTDKGFKDSLKLYDAMAGKQVKSAFMGLPDDAVVRYLRAMTPRNATRIIKEFKTPDEQARINRILYRMREAGDATSQPVAGGDSPSSAPPAASAPPTAASPGRPGQ